MFCKACGAEIVEGDKFCKKCGTKILDKSEYREINVTGNNSLESVQKKEKSPKVGRVIIIGCICIVAIVIICFVYSILKTRKNARELWSDEEVKEAYQEYLSEQNEGDTVATETESEQPVEEVQFDLEYHICQAYADVLTSFYYEDWSKIGIYGDSQQDEIYNMEENSFTVLDIDSDGVEELIINNVSTYTAAMASHIYSYDSKTGKAVKWDSVLSPTYTVYRNGYVMTESVRNNSMGDMFPFSIQRIQDREFYDMYYVSEWNVEYGEENYDGCVFPYEADIDGDGIVYVIEDSVSGNVKFADQEEYALWLNELLDGQDVLEQTEKSLNYSNIMALSDVYAENFQKEISRLKTTADIDLAYIYILGEDVMEETKDSIAFIKENADSFTYLGSKDGVQSIEYYMEDAGTIRYYGEAIPGVKLLGIQPGDTIEQAIEKLNMYGFYDGINWGLNGYINGYTCNSYMIDIVIESGRVSSIAIHSYNQYAG